MLLAKDRSKRVALVGHQPDLSALLSACVLGNHGLIPVDLKKNAIACVSFQRHQQAADRCTPHAAAAGCGATDRET